MLEREESRSLRLATNPLTASDLDENRESTADLAALERATLFERRRRKRRKILDLRREQSAAGAIEGLDKRTEIFGFTKGAFSIVDLIKAALELTGPAHAFFSTWTASSADVTTTLALLASGSILSSRWLVDLTFQRRQPELAKRIRDSFGLDAIRVAQNHAKFYTLKNDDWRLVIRTSMNLNFNPRFEDFSISHDPELWSFLDGIADEIWTKQKRTLADQTPHHIHKRWLADH